MVLAIINFGVKICLVLQKFSKLHKQNLYKAYTKENSLRNKINITKVQVYSLND